MGKFVQCVTGTMTCCGWTLCASISSRQHVDTEILREATSSTFQVPASLYMMLNMGDV